VGGVGGSCRAGTGLGDQSGTVAGLCFALLHALLAGDRGPELGASRGIEQGVRGSRGRRLEPRLVGDGSALTNCGFILH
jgi:hypothetical protein